MTKWLEDISKGFEAITHLYTIGLYFIDDFSFNIIL